MLLLQYQYFDVAKNDSDIVAKSEETLSDKISVTLNTSVVQTPTDVYQYGKMKTVNLW